MLFFFRLADSLMSYVAPVIMERELGSVALMGLVMSTSSIAGILTDLTFAKFFVNKKAKFYYKLMMVAAFLFPVTMLIFHNIVGFIFAMLIWGFYYEALGFGNYLFIDETVTHQEHAWAWGIVAFVVNIAYIFGPLLGSFLVDSNTSLPFYVTLSLYFISLIILIIVLLSIKHWKHSSQNEEQRDQHTFDQKIQIWKLYFSRMGHLLVLYMIFYFIDASFFSIGPIFAQSLKEIHPFGGLFVSLYSLPGLLGGLLVIKLAKNYSKKRIAFSGGIIAGLGLMLMSVLPDVSFILAMTGVASVGMSLMYPSLGAVMENLVGRSHQFAKDLIALSSVAGSIGYIIAPAFNGYLAELFSPQLVFSFWGMIMFVYSCFLLVTVRGKTRLPQTALQELVGN